MICSCVAYRDCPQYVHCVLHLRLSNCVQPNLGVPCQSLGESRIFPLAFTHNFVIYSVAGRSLLVLLPAHLFKQGAAHDP